MEGRPPGPRGGTGKASSEDLSGPSGGAGDKYRGSRKAAEQARARYYDRAARTPRKDRRSIGGSNLAARVVLLGAVVVLLFAAGYGLSRLGLFELPSWTDAPPQAEPKATPPQTAKAPAEPTAATGAPLTEGLENVPADPLASLEELKEKLLAGAGPATSGKAFTQGCMEVLDLARDLYGQGRSERANRLLARLDAILSPDLVKKRGQARGLALKEVSAEAVTSDKGKRVLVLEGRVENATSGSRDRVLLRAVLSDKDRKVVAKNFTLAGRTLSREGYFRPSAKMAQTLLDTSPDLDTVLGPESSLPFLFVFTDPPQRAERFAVKILLAPREP